MKSLKKYLPILLTLAMGTGCEETKIVQVGLSGDLKGTVTSYNYGFEKAGDQSGTKITVDGSVPEVTAVTNGNGEFTVNLKTGTYDLVIERTGFGTHKIQGLRFVGGEEPAMITTEIYALPKHEIVNLDLAIYESYGNFTWESTVYLDLPDDEERSYGYIRYYLHSDPDVSPSNYLETGIFSAHVNTGSFTYRKALNASLFPRGSTLYAVMYPCTDGYSRYIDIDTGNNVYSSIGLSGSDVKSVAIPNE